MQKKKKNEWKQKINKEEEKRIRLDFIYFFYVRFIVCLLSYVPENQFVRWMETQ